MYSISGKAYRTYGGPNKSSREIARILMEYDVVKIQSYARIARRNRRGSRPEGFEDDTSLARKDLR